MEEVTPLRVQLARQFRLWVIGHPSVAWHYLITQGRQSLVMLGILPAQRKCVTEVRAAFAANVHHAEFSGLWFDVNVVPWCLTFSRAFAREDPVRILEIGSFEGRSTIFLMTYFPKGHVTAIDTWSGSTNESALDSTRDFGGIEARFDANLAPYADRLTKRKGSSTNVLPQLLGEQQQFDFVYVDASHFSDDVLTDAITSWRMVGPGGVLIFDDLNWFNYPRLRDNPAWAVSAFLRFQAGGYKIVSVTPWQLTLQKA